MFIITLAQIADIKDKPALLEYFEYFPKFLNWQKHEIVEMTQIFIKFCNSEQQPNIPLLKESITEKMLEFLD